jgi:hypothetical protein
MQYTCIKIKTVVRRLFSMFRQCVFTTLNETMQILIKSLFYCLCRQIFHFTNNRFWEKHPIWTSLKLEMLKYVRVYIYIHISLYYINFSGLVVRMLASGIQVRGFKPGRSRPIFQGEKILSMPSFGVEVKPSVPCRMRHVKEPYNYRGSRNYRLNLIEHFSPKVPPFFARGILRLLTWSVPGGKLKKKGVVQSASVGCSALVGKPASPTQNNNNNNNTLYKDTQL